MAGRSRASKSIKKKSKASSNSVSITIPQSQTESRQNKQLPPLRSNPSDISSLVSDGSL